MSPAWVVPDFTVTRRTISFISGQPPVSVAKADASRIYLGFSVVQGSTYVVAPDSAVTNNSGYPVSTGGGPLEFFFRLHGALVSQEWFADQTQVGQMSVTEVIYMPRK